MFPNSHFPIHIIQGEHQKICKIHQGVELPADGLYMNVNYFPWREHRKIGLLYPEEKKSIEEEAGVSMLMVLLVLSNPHNEDIF